MRKYLNGKHFNHKFKVVQKLPANIQLIAGLDLMPLLVMVYIDDIIIASDSHEEHVRHFEVVFARLNEVNLKANTDKCQLGLERVIILGHEIFKHDLKLSTGKLARIANWEDPKNIKMLQSQLGFFNYFREFIPSKLMAPIERLREKGKIVFRSEHRNIYQKLVEILESGSILLEFPDFTKPLYVETDASKYGIAAILYQLDNEGRKRYIRFASRALSKQESATGASQRELMAVLFALRSFRVYLFGFHFELFTDHKSLTYLLERPKLSSVIQNYMDELGEFRFKITHLPGIENHLPDALSRFYGNNEREEVTSEGIFLAGVIEDLRIQTEDLEEVPIIDSEEEKRTVMHRAHLARHMGASTMATSIRALARVRWANMMKDCQAFVSACLQCQRYNVGKHGFHPPKNVEAVMPLDHMRVDVKEMPLSAKGHKYLLVVIEVATRFVFLRPMKDKTMYSVAGVLLRLFCDIGFPKIIGSDNGTEFVNELIIALKTLSKIDERLIAPYHHRSNSIAEKAIESVSRAIYKAIEGSTSQWDDFVPAI